MGSASKRKDYMKRLLSLFLLCPLFSIAQPGKLDSIFIKSIPANLSTRIPMPEIEYNPFFNLDMFFSYDKKIRIFPIKEDSVYRKFFSTYVYTNDSLKKYQHLGADLWQYKWMLKHQVDSLPAINFSTTFLIVYSACVKCLEVCHHKKGDNSCHRAACNFKEAWFIGKKPRPLGWD